VKPPAKRLCTLIGPLLMLLLSGLPLQPALGATALNVSIAVFDPGVPEDPALHRDLQVFPRIREVEAMLLPFVLRETLAATGEWGAVRVVPEPDAAAELLVTGAIGQSDGETLQVDIRAVDASGRLWLDRAFFGVPGDRTFYSQIAAELRQARAGLNEKALDDIVEISLLRYGNRLAPSAFGEYLREAADGAVEVRRLPATNDPMVGRIKRLRETEYVITDAVDTKFQELHREIASVHEVWREYRRKNIQYREGDARRAQATMGDAPRGSYEALRNLYDNYKFDRITAQEQDRLAVAFNNEVGPKVEAMEARVAELEGWVDEKYAEWNRILEELFEVETAFEE